MNVFKVRFQFFYAAIFLSFAGLANSSIVIDFAQEVDGSRRFITFHTLKQKLLLYATSTQPVTQPINLTLKNCFSDVYQQEGALLDAQFKQHLLIQPDGSLQITSTNILPPAYASQLIILSTHHITANIGGFLDPIPGINRYCWSAQRIVERTPLEILQIVPKTKKEKVGDFLISRDNDSNVHTLRSLSTDRKHILGELLTQITLLTFGYECLPSQYEKTHGLDGVFRSFSQQFLLLTQSKAGDSNDRAPTVMKNELNERHISIRLLKMKSAKEVGIVISHGIVMSYVCDRPLQLFKMAHCILDKGIGQVEVQPFDIQAFPKEGVAIFNAPVDEKIKAVATTLKAFEADPTRQLCLAMASVSIKDVPIESAFDYMCAAYSLDDKTKAAMLEILRKK